MVPNGQPVTVQCRRVGVDEGGAGEVELPADVGAGQQYLLGGEAVVESQVALGRELPGL